MLFVIRSHCIYKSSWTSEIGKIRKSLKFICCWRAISCIQTSLALPDRFFSVILSHPNIKEKKRSGNARLYPDLAHRPLIDYFDYKRWLACHCSKEASSCPFQMLQSFSKLSMLRLTDEATHHKFKLYALNKEWL